MKVAHITLIGLIALATISCDKITKKNNRSSNQSEDAPAELPADSGDATVDTPVTNPKPKDPATDPAMALSGKDLYAKLCASCHQDLDKTDVGKTPLPKLQNAIAMVPTMAGLKDTPEKDLEAIVAVLKDAAPGKGKDKAAMDAAEEQ